MLLIRAPRGAPPCPTPPSPRPARRPPQRDHAGSPPAAHHGARAAPMALRRPRPHGRRQQAGGRGARGAGRRPTWLRAGATAEAPPLSTSKRPQRRSQQLPALVRSGRRSASRQRLPPPGPSSARKTRAPRGRKELPARPQAVGIPYISCARNTPLPKLSKRLQITFQTPSRSFQTLPKASKNFQKFPGLGDAQGWRAG